MYKLDEARVPDPMVPIAHDPGGNLVCISVTGEDAGKVYFCDHEGEYANGQRNRTESNVHLVADSFTEFITSLST